MAAKTQKDLSSADKIKAAALTLMAQSGADGVTVRDIAQAAGQKNAASIGYYFGSKEHLIREIVSDCAEHVDARRNAALDNLEQEGGPTKVEEIVDILIFPAVEPSKFSPDESENRFLLLLSLTHQDLFYEIVEDGRNVGYQRCLDHLRRLLPNIPKNVCNERFVFLSAYLGAVLAAREVRLKDSTRQHRMWGQKKTLKHLARTTCALLRAPHIT